MAEPLQARLYLLAQFWYEVGRDHLEIGGHLMGDSNSGWAHQLLEITEPRPLGSGGTESRKGGTVDYGGAWNNTGLGLAPTQIVHSYA